MFGLPGGEILEFIEAARQEGIEFVLTRDEATAAFMADVTGQIQRTPGVCVATLGPGAVNMTLGVANAYLDRSPLIAITASWRHSAEPLRHASEARPERRVSAVHQDGDHAGRVDTAAKVRRAIRASRRAAHGARAHRAAERCRARGRSARRPTRAQSAIEPAPAGRAAAEAVARVAAAIRRRPTAGRDSRPRSGSARARAASGRSSSALACRSS